MSFTQLRAILNRALCAMLLSAFCAASSPAGIALAAIPSGDQSTAHMSEPVYDNTKGAALLVLRRLPPNADDALVFNLQDWDSTDFRSAFYGYVREQRGLHSAYELILNKWAATDPCAANLLAMQGIDGKHGVSTMLDDLSALSSALRNAVTQMKSVETGLEQRLNSAVVKRQKTDAIAAKLKTLRDIITELQSGIDDQLAPEVKSVRADFLAAVTNQQKYKCPGFVAAPPPPPSGPLGTFVDKYGTYHKLVLYANASAVSGILSGQSANPPHARIEWTLGNCKGPATYLNCEATGSWITSTTECTVSGPVLLVTMWGNTPGKIDFVTWDETFSKVTTVKKGSDPCPPQGGTEKANLKRQ